MSIILTIILLNLLISLLSLVGAGLIAFKINTKRIGSYLVSFAAGVLLAAAFLDILPEALETHMHDQVLSAVLIGMTIGFFMERFLLWYHHHHDESHKIHPSAALVLFGDGLHNFIDGIAIAATYLVNPALGLTTTIAIAAHEIPQELADFSVLIHSGFSNKKALFYNLASAATAVFGGIFGFYFLNQFHEMIPVALGFTAGIFIYIASADLIPELHRDFKKRNSFLQALTFALGLMLIFFITKTFVE